ncbi:MAG: peptide deformylase [Bacteroidales bacterium]|nr:peptide deformylase [Bacteroidales bacterium]
MVLPIYVFGHPVLRKVAKDIDKDFPDFDNFMNNMWETMYKTDGVGLAAPQIGQSIRVFVLDAGDMAEDFPEAEGFKSAFINAKIVEETGEDWAFNEGCLSIPNIREDVKRKSSIKIQYYDQDWNYHEKVYDGVIARIIQHEYDHLEGKMFTDRLSPIKRRLLKSKLAAISKGKVSIKYKIITA